MEKISDQKWKKLLQMTFETLRTLEIWPRDKSVCRNSWKLCSRTHIQRTSHLWV